MDDEIEFPKFEISDLQDVLYESPSFVSDIELCVFKECMQLRCANFFCNEHYDMVYRPRKRQKNLIKSDDQCAAKRCFKMHEPENFLCFEHIVADKVNIQHKFYCKEKDCKRIRLWDEKYCIVHCQK